MNMKVVEQIYRISKGSTYYVTRRKQEEKGNGKIEGVQ